MPRIIRQYDPNETARRVVVDIQEESCPGLLKFLAHLPYGHEASLLRAIIYQWFLAHQEHGDLEYAVKAFLEGPGGRPDNRQPKEAEFTALRSFIQGQDKKPAKRRTTKSLDK
ncbi:hypothetical protein [Noviherbaspirillum pedocola]|uniref:Uncharacterized protein n=1 Tax=Noviherbaspirillum pedocola TaxID=2801341 RepID=A0A934T3M8_9BURK|nr:hypothetical protein [Noviherbaspirillum pedocola]MBK4737948.1 hypothetical protein [Noviherbaspirillum pedocola]